MLKYGKIDKLLFCVSFCAIFHAFSWQNSCLETSFIVQKHNTQLRERVENCTIL